MKRCLMVTGGPLDLSFGRRFLLGRTYDLVIAVDAGLAACEALGLCPDLLVGDFDIKSKISEFDIFIGARMHATIGAFSSGVATIPTAYSRKFNGLYESVEYPYIVDLLNSSTEENLEMTKMYIKDYVKLKVAAEKSMDYINLLERQTISLLKEQIIKC